MKQLFLLICSAIVLTACSSDDEPVLRRTVVVYMSGENDLSGYVQTDLNEMTLGSQNISSHDNLIVFVDRADSDEKPYVARIEKGRLTVDTEFAMGEFYSSDPQKFKDVLSWIVNKYPAESYGLVLWGHANGWLIMNDTNTNAQYSPRKDAYGRDTGDNTPNRSKGLWLNISDMAAALKQLPVKWQFIFFDCCNMQNIEVAYELRGITNYLIGSPAEIPGSGAPYDKIMGGLFSKKSSFYQQIVDDYANSSTSPVPLSVINANTQELEMFASATNAALQAIQPTKEHSLDMAGLIYYFGSTATEERIMYDMNDAIMKFAPSNIYDTWKYSLTRLVVYKKNATSWATGNHVNFDDFKNTDEKFGGISMFFPLKEYDEQGKTWNKDIKKTAWYQAVQWDKYGW